MTKTTEAQLKVFLARAERVFHRQMERYGLSWLAFSPVGFADQIFIKANRLKSLCGKTSRRVPESPEEDLLAIFNYCILALISSHKAELAQLLPSPTSILERPNKSIMRGMLRLYTREISKALRLMRAKNHDYGNAWQQLSVEGLADLLCTKSLRLKVMTKGIDTISDEDDLRGIIATLQDQANYSLLTLVRQAESTTKRA